jgi:PAS domain S-box-containing protein
VIAEANLAAAELLRKRRGDLSGKRFSEFLTPEQIPAFEQYLATTRGSSTVQSFEGTLEIDGGAVHVQLSSRLAASPASRHAPIHTAITDISEAKRVQEALRETNAEQEAFTYSISHDLRAPLITITNYSEFLATEYGQQLDDTARDVLSRIQRAAQRMDDVLQNLLVYSRVSRAQTLMGPIDIGNIVTETLIQHQGVIQESHAVINLQPSYPHAQGSRELLGQVLSNLLTNAIKYTAKNQPPVVSIKAWQDEQNVTLTVSDEGIGIPATDQDRIFKIFERLHGQSAYPGTGIGLAVVKRAVERMSGRVWVESHPGQGSRFHVALPLSGSACPA